MKKAIYFSLIAGFLSVFCSRCLPLCGFAGSNPCVKYWTFKIKESELIEIIKEVKRENPNLQPPTDTGLVKGRYSYWFEIHFYFSDTKETVYTFTNPEDSLSSSFALVGFSSEKYGRRDINADYKWLENAKMINKFKREILAPVKQKIKQRERK